MEIREANISDFAELYKLGENTPEFKVSATEKFMDKDEFTWAITNPQGVFLTAKNENKIIGFIYANGKDADKPFKNKYACLVYLVVKREFRRRGLAKKLYDECEKRLKKLGVTNIYGWADDEGSGAIIKFMKKQGFAEGQRYVWMDKKIL